MRNRNIEITHAHVQEMFGYDEVMYAKAVDILEQHKDSLSNVVKAWKEAGLVLRPNAVKKLDDGRMYMCWAAPMLGMMFTVDIYFGYWLLEVDCVIPLDKYMRSKGFNSCFDVCPDTEGNGVMILGFKWVGDKCEVRPLRYPRGKARRAYIEDGVVHWCNVQKRRMGANHITHIKERLVRLQTNNSGNVQLQQELQELIGYIDQFGA